MSFISDFHRNVVKMYMNIHDDKTLIYKRHFNMVIFMLIMEIIFLFTSL